MQPTHTKVWRPQCRQPNAVGHHARLALNLKLLTLTPITLTRNNSVTLLGIIARNGARRCDIGVRILVLVALINLLPAVILVVAYFAHFVVILSLLHRTLKLRRAPPGHVLVNVTLSLAVLIVHPV